MLRKGESQLRVGRENPQQQHSRTSWVQSSGMDGHNIPHTEWACPPLFIVDPNWKMEAGSESRETNIQIQRESRTAEAMYLRCFDIPANPSVAPDACDFNGDDGCVPIIPLDVINDETSPDDGTIPPITSSPTVEVEETATQPLTAPLGPQVKERPEIGRQPLLQRDEVVGTAVALVALIKSKEPGSRIDLELLIQLLRNPGMLEQLMKEHGLSTNQSSIITSSQPQEKPSVPLTIPREPLDARLARSKPDPVVTGFTPFSVPEPKVAVNLAKVPVAAHGTWSPSVPFAHSMSQEVKYMIEQIHRNSVSQSNGSMPLAPMVSAPSPSSPKFDVGKVRKLIDEYGGPLGAHPVKPGNSPSPSAARTRPIVIKDSDYYRRLILQHGSNPNPQVSAKTVGMSPVESRPQEQRPCVYFNSPRGCRHGSSCRFQHTKVNLEGRSQAVIEMGTKRMKLSGGNFARHT